MSSLKVQSKSRNVQSARAAIESLESRTLLSTSGTPSLLVTVPGPLPATAIAGATIHAHIRVNIANDGTGPSTGSTTVTLYASPDGTYNSTDAQLGTITKSGLRIPAGFSKNVTVNVKTLPQNLDGSYFALANVIALTQTVQGVSTTAVDVTPAHIDLSNAVVAVPAVAHLGKKVAVTLDVTNDGNVIAKGFLDTLFELSTSLDGSNPFQLGTLRSHIGIKPGKTAKLHFHVPVALGSPSGNQFIVAVLDPTDVFNDSDLVNNTAISATPVSFR